MADRREFANDPVLSLKVAMQGWQSAVWTALPGFVTKYDATKMTCEIQPTIQGQFRNQYGVMTWETMPLLLDCPVLFPAAGGFVMTFPIAAGDEVLVVFSSRCIDSWWQSGGIQQQAELRMHDLSDGFVLLAPRSLPHVPGSISTTAVEIRNVAGTSLISILPDGDIVLTAPTVRVNGNVMVSGDISTGAGSIPSVNTHTHGGVKGGGDTSGPPTTGS